nr:LysM peptidoglycan-binding domain-containing protein [Acetobacter fallax]
MSKSIQVSPSDISLWHIAARFLGDATQANRIMILNNLSDTWISSLNTIILPPVDNSQTGGINT